MFAVHGPFTDASSGWHILWHSLPVPRTGVGAKQLAATASCIFPILILDPDSLFDSLCEAVSGCKHT